MSQVSADDVRRFVIQELAEGIRAVGVEPDEVPDDFDLHRNGVIDSFGILELISALEERYALEIDFEELDPEDLTIIGPFSRFVEQKSREAA